MRADGLAEVLRALSIFCMGRGTNRPPGARGGGFGVALRGSLVAVELEVFIPIRACACRDDPKLQRSKQLRVRRKVMSAGCRSNVCRLATAPTDQQVCPAVRTPPTLGRCHVSKCASVSPSYVPPSPPKRDTLDCGVVHHSVWIPTHPHPDHPTRARKLNKHSP